jgi:predicted oxidoreductase
MLARWMNHFSQLFNVQRVSDDRQTEICTTELLPGPSSFEVEMATENLIIPKSPGIDQIPAEMIKARG